MIEQRSWSRGVTALETTFVFSSIIFFSFAMVNFGASLHTRFIANYAAFMAARSYQVYGAGTGSEFFQESADGIGTDNLLGDQPIQPVMIRVAEDIFTCSLPWVGVDPNDVVGQAPDSPRHISEDPRCMEGRRRYETTNVDQSFGLVRFDGQQTTELETVEGGFTELDRTPLRFGILRMRYPLPVYYNPMNVFSRALENRSSASVFTPLIINPGVDPGEILEADDSDNAFDERLQEQNEQVAEEGAPGGDN